jgi:hypothetical protein
VRSLCVGLALATLLGVTACGSGSGSVPARVRQEVQNQEGKIGFLPTQLPQGYSYKDSQLGGAGGFDLFFSNPSGEEIGFHVVKASCKSWGSTMHTFEANGLTVKWSATYQDQQAWRCLAVNGTEIGISASRSVSGDDSLRSPQQRQDAEQMVDLVAHAQVAH